MLITIFIVFILFIETKKMNKAKNLELYEDQFGNVNIRGLKKHVIKDIRDAYGLIS